MNKRERDLLKDLGGHGYGSHIAVQSSPTKPIQHLRPHYTNERFKTPQTVYLAKGHSLDGEYVKGAWNNIQIHRAKPGVFPMGFTRAADEAFSLWAARAGLSEWDFGQLPYGAIVCTADLVDIYNTGALLPKLKGRVQFFGDFTPGRYAWHLENIKPLKTPMIIKGQQGLWPLSDEVSARLDEAVKA